MLLYPNRIEFAKPTKMFFQLLGTNAFLDDHFGNLFLRKFNGNASPFVLLNAAPEIGLVFVVPTMKNNACSAVIRNTLPIIRLIMRIIRNPMAIS